VGIRGLRCSFCLIGENTRFLFFAVCGFRVLPLNPRYSHEMAPAYGPVPQATEDAGEICIHSRGRIRNVVCPEVWTPDPSSSEAVSSPTSREFLSITFSL